MKKKAAVGLSAAFLVLTLASYLQVSSSSIPIDEQAYIQLGDHAKLSNPEAMDLVWVVREKQDNWKVEVHDPVTNQTRQGSEAVCRTVDVSGVVSHRVCSAQIDGLQPGMPFEYKIIAKDKVRFSGTAKARASENQFYKFAVFGDTGEGSLAERMIAHEVAKRKPDFVMIPGDIVYRYGRAAEYMVKFFPVFNAAEDSATGVPLMQSTLFMASVGNHDVNEGGHTRSGDRLAYFYYFDLPKNGPIRTASDASAPPYLGPHSERKSFQSAAASYYPETGMYSFDYGNAHWLVLDSNNYVDWGSKALRDWVASDLKSAGGATWRFVAFHHPPFHSAAKHSGEQWMRSLCDLFQNGKVDIVFTGHVHNYERTFPLTFDTATSHWTLDRQYDGVSNTKPKGILYLVSGGGGADLYGEWQDNAPNTWQPYTSRFVSRTHSFTLVDVKDKQLTFTQIAQDGTEVDRFAVTK